MNGQSFPGGDSQPWYRQFWPWFLILLPASVVVASLCTMYIAYHGADDLVVDEYYKDGLAINRQLEHKKRSEELGITANLDFRGNHVTARVSGPVDAAGLTLLMSHPMESERDFTVALTRIAPGIYQGVLQGAIATHWHWTLTQDQGDDWRLDGDVEPRDIGDAASD